MKVIIDPPEGFEEEAEYRYPLSNEFYLDGNGSVLNLIGRARGPRIVLKQKPFYKELCGQQVTITNVVHPKNTKQKPIIEMSFSAPSGNTYHLRAEVDLIEVERPGDFL